MGVIDTLRGIISGDQRTYTYACRDCGHEFESTERKVTNAECPECGSSFTRDALI